MARARWDVPEPSPGAAPELSRVPDPAQTPLKDIFGMAGTLDPLLVLGSGSPSATVLVGVQEVTLTFGDAPCASQEWMLSQEHSSQEFWELGQVPTIPRHGCPCPALSQGNHP